MLAKFSVYKLSECNYRCNTVTTVRKNF